MSHDRPVPRLSCPHPPSRPPGNTERECERELRLHPTGTPHPSDRGCGGEAAGPRLAPEAARSDGQSGAAGPGQLTFVVEETAVHQDEPALVPLPDPRAGLRGARGTDRRGREPGVGPGAQAGRALSHDEAIRPLTRGSSARGTPDAGNRHGDTAWGPQFCHPRPRHLPGEDKRGRR